MEKFVQIIQQQPKPLPLKRPYTLLLEDLVDPLPLGPATKKYCPESVDSLVIQWVESVLGLESYRGRYCRSDTLLNHSHSDIIPRRFTKSMSNMEYRRNADGFVLPPTSASTRSHSYRTDAEDDAQMSWYSPSIAVSNMSSPSTGSGRRSLVEDPLYRQNNLAENNIYICSSREQYPEHIASLINHVRLDRSSPGPSSDQVWQDVDLENLEMGTGAADVEDYFKNKIFPKPASLDILKRIDRTPMAKKIVPDIGSKLKVSIPCPDMLYGYNSLGAFPQQQIQFRSMGNEMVANTQNLIYPFFVIEFKADGPGGSGSLWTATNQCLGGSASCINIVESLNRRLKQCKNKKVQAINSTVFSIAMNGTEARLYISWKHNEFEYYTQKIDSFLLQKPKDYIEFRKYIRNIIDWGKEKRLNEIRDSLNSLLEESRHAASQLAKSCPPPSSDDSVRRSSQKRKCSSSRRTNTVHDRSVPPQDHGYDSAANNVYALPPANDSSVQYAPPPDHRDFPTNNVYALPPANDSSFLYAPPRDDPYEYAQ
ncbi:hypothetical protein EAF04_001488 [Stromatinia cepivora]|nr:hypothetical protein EAF04_001488 [Stromatinia cepivora]